MGSGPTAALRGRHLLRGTFVVATIFAAGLITAGVVSGAGPLAVLSSDETPTATETTNTDTTSTDPGAQRRRRPRTTTRITTQSTPSPSDPPTVSSDKDDYAPRRIGHAHGRSVVPPPSMSTSTSTTTTVVRGNASSTSWRTGSGPDRRLVHASPTGSSRSTALPQRARHRHAQRRASPMLGFSLPPPCEQAGHQHDGRGKRRDHSLRDGANRRVRQQRSMGIDWLADLHLAARAKHITCVDTPDHPAAGTSSESFSITAPAPAGTFNAYFIAYVDDSCGGVNGANTPSNTFVLTNGVTGSSSTTLHRPVRSRNRRWCRPRRTQRCVMLNLSATDAVGVTAYRVASGSELLRCVVCRRYLDDVVLGQRRSLLTLA